MSYPIEIRLADKRGFHTPPEARKHYGRYSRDGVTVHWWDDPKLIKDSDHDNIVNYILGKAQRGIGSVNYVVSNNKITMLVNSDNVAWASQGGNPTTVSIEFSPHLSAEGYKKGGWLINELFNPTNGKYKRVPEIYEHKKWFKTICPGTVSVITLRNEVNKWARGGYNPPTTQPPKPLPTPPASPKNTDFVLWKDGGEYICNKQPTIFHDLTNVSKWSDPIPAKLTFGKGEKITIVGSFKNVGLNKEYYITRSSFDRKSATGFNPVDLDIFVPPRPLPKPPETLPTPPVEVTLPTPPVIPPTEYPGWFVSFWLRLIDAIKSILVKDK